jgi:hypothetical protein
MHPLYLRSCPQGTKTARSERKLFSIARCSTVFDSWCLRVLVVKGLFRQSLRYVFLLAALLCVGCAAQSTPTEPGAAAPSPTIFAAPIGTAGGAPTPSPAVPAPTMPPLVLVQPAGGSPVASDGQALYLWPAYVPPGFQPSPDESRVSGENQVGTGGLGFYIITLNAGAQKLTIGGGGLPDTLPLTGDERRIEVAGRSARLISSGDRHEIIFEVPQGQLFLYGAGIGEDELLKVAESLQPTDLATLRALAGVG